MNNPESKHEGHGDSKEYTIIVNARPKVVTTKELSFADVVILAYVLALGLSDPNRLSLSEPIGMEQNRGQGPGFVIQRVLARQSLRPQVVAGDSTPVPRLEAQAG
ncbi:MAG TPA: hypothetical protein VGK74_08510 [Symbiobacteriaceae bacterium]